MWMKNERVAAKGGQILRDEKDRPFPGPTRTGFGPDFRSWSVTDRGLGPDWSGLVLSGPVRDFRTENGFFARNFALNAVFLLKFWKYQCKFVAKIMIYKRGLWLGVVHNRKMYSVRREGGQILKANTHNHTIFVQKQKSQSSNLASVFN